MGPSPADEVRQLEICMQEAGTIVHSTSAGAMYSTRWECQL